jgi:IclR family transcriptional regulator, pca regulon regulatory protein
MTVDKDRARQSHSVVLERGLEILSTFGYESKPLGVAEVARHLGMKPSTVHRYLRTLTSLGYLQQDADLKYRPHIKAAGLGLAAINSLDVRETARPHLKELCETWGVTVNMAVRDGIEIVYVERIIGKRGFDLPLVVGSRQPTYCNSMGKVLLAFAEPRELEELVTRIDFIQLGPNTITDPEHLKLELAQVREQGYAICNEEMALNLRAVAAPVRDVKDNVVAAINLHASPFSLDEVKQNLSPAITATALLISRQLGAPGATQSPDPRV